MPGKLTTAERATIMDACQSISRSADALKECHTVDGDWGDDGDAKAFYDAELRLLDRLTALLAHPGQPEPRECRHCGWMCIPNSTPSTTHYPLPQPEPRAEVTDTEPQWIVNDLGELGVKVGGRFFFLYKGDNIEYGANSSSDGIALHDDGSPMQYRIVGKREFGETCLPVKWILQGRSEDRYHEKLVYHPRLSFGKPEDGDWKLLPAARAQGGES